MDPTNIWDEYPQELLTEADSSRAVAEDALINQPVCIVDPYNVSFSELIKLWMKRRYPN